jgi:hypothetical protein
MEAKPMNEAQANALESILGGEAWHKPGLGWVVTVNRSDGAIIQFTDAGVTEYPDDAALDADKPTKAIELCTDSDDEGWWVIVDYRGNVIYRDPDTASGWRWQQDAEHEAAGLKSRTGDSYSVRRLE